MHIERFSTRTYETDFNNRLRISSVLNYMQEVAANNAEDLGFGFKKFTEQGIFWVLSRVHIEMVSYPVIGEPFIVETWPKSLVSPFALRDFLFYNEAGVTIGKATTAWLIINRESMRPVRPEPVMEGIVRNENRHAIEEMPEKLQTPASMDLVGVVQAAYTDIDVNQHVNNVKYMEYVLNTYPESELRNRMITGLQINFLQECRFGESLEILRSDNPESKTDHFEGRKSNGNRVFQADLVFA
jgi:acyl-ACP thioesterase